MSTMYSLIFVLFIAWLSTLIAFFFGMSWFWTVGFLLAFLVACCIHGRDLMKAEEKKTEVK